MSDQVKTDAELPRQLLGDRPFASRGTGRGASRQAARAGAAIIALPAFSLRLCERLPLG